MLQNSFRIMEWLLGQNEFLVEAKHGLADYQLSTSFRNSNVTDAYPFRDEVIRQTLTMEFANKLERAEQGPHFREGRHRICAQ